jgi:hypothetical protein
MEGRHRERGPLPGAGSSKDTWHLRQWLVVEVLIGILEFHDIAMEGDEDREVSSTWYSDSSDLQRRTQRDGDRFLDNLMPINTKRTFTHDASLQEYLAARLVQVV